MCSTAKKLTYIVLILSLVVCCTSKKRSTFELKGNIQGLQKDTLTIRYTNHGERVRKSSPVSNGSFSFQGSLETPTKTYLNIKERRTIPVYLENSIITVSGDLDSLSKVTVKGSKVHNTYKRHQEGNPQIDVNQFHLFKEIQKAKENEDYKIYR